MDLINMVEEGGEPPTLARPTPLNPYPWGLRLNITHEQLAKLGYDELPPAGTEIHLEATACVVRCTSEDPDADGDCDYSCIELQIKELGIEQEGDAEEDDEDEDGDNAARAERMYAKNKQPA